MNKNIKYTIAVMLIIGAFSGALPAKDFVFGNIEVYAATYNSASKTEMSGNENTQNVETKNSNNKTNTWKNVNGKFKYLDGTGQALKNQWWFNKNTGMSYYLKEDGDRAKGWLQNKNNWYYFNQGGEMQTGWVCIDNNWYYLNKGGAMKIGWFEDAGGNWYYLDSTGKMIKDSTIDGFKLGANGALVNSNT